MKFHDLIIENFLAITDAKVNLADRGLVAIQGVNHVDTSAQSNGAGKSTIPDALSWVWFGTTARGVSGDDVINDKAKKGTMVRSVAVDGGITYTATRYRKHKTGKNTFTITAFDGLTTTDLTKGTEKLTQEVATKIIGSSLEVFTGSIYAGQERMPDLPAMTDKQLKVLIEEAAGVTALEAAYKLARENHAAEAATLASIQGELVAAASNLEWNKEQIERVRQAEDEWSVRQSAEIKRLTGELAAYIPQIRELDEDIAVADLADIEAKIASCDAKIAAVAAEQKTVGELTAAVSKAEAEANHASAEVTRHQRLMALAEKEIETVDHKIGCPCSECGRPLSEAELGETLSAAEKRLEVCKANLEATNAHAIDALKAFKSAQEALEAFKLTMTDVSAESATRSSLLAAKTAAMNLQRERDQIALLARQLKAQIETKRTEKSPHAGQVAALNEALEKAERAHKEITERLAKQTGVVALEAEVVKVFSPVGVRAHILDEVTPFLNTQTAQYLVTLSDGNIDAVWSTLTPNAKGELREKFSIDVTSSTGGKTFRNLSGGEKRKVRIATALALQDLVATRASKPIDLFIGDEIDDALDPAGLERLMAILEAKARERGSVFIISHNELRDHIRNVLTVEKTASGTTITELAA